MFQEMMIKNKKYLFFALALLFIGLIWFSVFRWEPNEPPQQEQTSESDYFISNFSMTSYNAQGTIQTRIKGEHLEHYTHSDIIQIISPQITLMRQGKATWNMDAQYAFMGKKDEIILSGDIKINQTTEAYLDPIYITTTSLRILPEHQLVDSNDYFELQTETAKLQGQGLNINLNQRTIQLLSKVKGIYNPNVKAN